MAPLNLTTTAKSARKSLTNDSDKVVKRPARGYHKYKNGLLNVTPKGREIDLVKSNQSSPLLRLPPEIRNRIWEYTLGGVVFRTHTYWGRRRYRVKFKACENESNIGLALLRTCRQIYSETATMPIRLNTMACLSVLSFENAAKQLQPYQRKYITKIRIETYGIGSDIMQKFDHRLDFPTAFPGLKLIQIIAFNAANPRSPLTLDEFEARIRKIFGLLSNSSAIQLKVIECKTAMPTSRREFCWA